MKLRCKQVLALVFSLSLTNISNAGGTHDSYLKRVVCPVVSSTYEDVVLQLKSISDSLNTQPECNGIRTELSDMQSLKNAKERKLFNKIRKNEVKARELDPEEVESLIGYTDVISGKLSSIINSIQNRNKDCKLKESNVSILSSVASIAQETTSVVGSYSGPYDIPLQLAGGAFASLLRGIDAIVNNDVGGYNFNNEDHALLFAKSVCIYNDVKNEIENIMDPIWRDEIYEKLLGQLDIKESKITSHHEEQVLQYKALHQIRIKINSWFEEVFSDIQTIYATNNKPQEQCRQLVDMVQYPKSDLNMIVEELSMSTLQTEAINLNPKLEQTGTVVVTIETSDIPKWKETSTANQAHFHNLQATLTKVMSEANKDPQTVLSPRLCSFLDDSVANKINTGIVTDLKQLQQDVWRSFDKSMDLLYSWGSLNKIAAIDTKTGDDIEINVIRWIRGTLNKKDWGAKQKKDLAHLSSAGNALGVSTVSKLNEKLHSRMFTKIAPQFVKWFYNKAQKEVSRINKANKNVAQSIRKQVRVYDDANSFFRDFFRRGLGLWDSKISITGAIALIPVPENTTLNGFTNEQTTDLPDFEFAKVYRKLDSLNFIQDQLRAAVKVHQEFCLFFKESSLYTKEVVKQCERDMSSIHARIKKCKADLVEIRGYKEWCHKNGLVKADSILYTTNSISACHAGLRYKSTAIDPNL